jgi:hypothetical protein
MNARRNRRSADLLESLGLRASAAGLAVDHPDHALLGDLAELSSLSINEIFRGNHKGFDLLIRVTNTPAKTAAGAMAKFQYLLDAYPAGGEPWSLALPLSAIRDAMAHCFTGAATTIGSCAP